MLSVAAGSNEGEHRQRCLWQGDVIASHSAAPLARLGYLAEFRNRRRRLEERLAKLGGNRDGFKGSDNPCYGILVSQKE